jgi:lipopolysaccharide/colanic/teichoic acid biosynthesis glycosyltransferase
MVGCPPERAATWEGTLTTQVGGLMGRGQMGMDEGRVEARDFDAAIEDSDAVVEQDLGRVAQDDAVIEIDLRFADPAVVLPADESPSTVHGANGTIAGWDVPVPLPLRPPSVGAEPSTSPEHALGGLLQNVVVRSGTRTTVGLTYAVLKRASDVLLSSVLFLVLLPLLVMLAAAVGFTSRGPVVYRQKRVGRDKSTFTIFKFRTMTVDADQRLDEMAELAETGELEPVDGPVFKAPDDPRVTKVGRLLRKTNLDELPQLLNILAGNMALVGPRPLVAQEIETLDPQHATVRQSVRPGITCLWQVVRTGHMTFAERMALDLLYVERRSVSVDMALVFLTPIAVLKGNRSY